MINNSSDYSRRNSLVHKNWNGIFINLDCAWKAPMICSLIPLWLIHDANCQDAPITMQIKDSESIFFLCRAVEVEENSHTISSNHLSWRCTSSFQMPNSFRAAA